MKKRKNNRKTESELKHENKRRAEEEYSYKQFVDDTKIFTEYFRVLENPIDPRLSRNKCEQIDFLTI